MINVNQLKLILVFISICYGIGFVTDSWAREGDLALIQQIEMDTAANVPLVNILKKTAGSGMDIKNVVSTLIRSGTDPYLVVYTAITEGLPAQQVVAAAVNTNVPLEAVVKAAVKAGADKNIIAKGAIDGGVSPSFVANVIAAVDAPVSPVYGYSSAAGVIIPKSNNPKGLQESMYSTEHKDHPTKPGSHSKPHHNK